MRSYKKRLEEFSQTKKRLACVEQELANVRKAYEEVSERGELIRKGFETQITYLSQELSKSQDARSKATNERDQMRTLAEKFAREKERDAATIATLTEILDKVYKSGERVTAELEKERA
jgi:septal ring factor EnvC (AmiA/AmiB activator)